MSEDDDRAEPRYDALMRARLRGSGLERDACILNISPQGLQLTATVPPRPDQPVTIVANGYAMTGEVKWVRERNFGVSLLEPIQVDDVIEAKILQPGPRVATSSLPENFGIRPEVEPVGLTLLNLLDSKWVRLGLIVVGGGSLAVYAGSHVGEQAGKMAESMAAMQEVSQAEGNAVGH